MIEFHGWISLTVEGDQAGKALLRELSRFGAEHRVSGARVINGQYLVWVAGAANHRSPDADSVLALFRAVGAAEKEAYGVLYIRDDENGEFSNEFEVCVLSRGRVRSERDTLLSPCIPEIEEVEPQEGHEAD